VDDSICKVNLTRLLKIEDGSVKNLGHLWSASYPDFFEVGACLLQLPLQEVLVPPEVAVLEIRRKSDE
jgi:hypothetical protein